ncbi:MAG: arsenic resistance N-acetyltransferase ArsN2 [candidate division Zixibacteria bacterium]|jgi:amino-acid N-acetyltransferase|nr:arsenic resistance N-acetyltransferase ArsN2 [candidate division Zixibacteria bacterium]
MASVDFDLRFRKALASDLPVITALIADHDLPTRDLSEKLDSLWIATQVDLLVGVGGLEVHGDHGLLRSMVTTERFRGKGFGRVLTDFLLAHAREQKLVDVYLLTLTAAGFFRKLGFERVARADVPNDIQRTSEFAELCPQSAVCMKITIVP